jgi:hypothetical protein
VSLGGLRDLSDLANERLQSKDAPKKWSLTALAQEAMLLQVANSFFIVPHYSPNVDCPALQEIVLIGRGNKTLFRIFSAEGDAFVSKRFSRVRSPPVAQSFW